MYVRPTGGVSLTQTRLAGNVPELFTYNVNDTESFGIARGGTTAIPIVTFASSSRPYVRNQKSVGRSGFIQPVPVSRIARPPAYVFALLWCHSYASFTFAPFAATIQYVLPCVRVGVGVSGALIREIVPPA